MKASGEVIFGKKAIRETWSARQGTNKEGMRQGARPSPGHALHPRGPLLAPLSYFFPYIYQYTLKPSGNRIDWEFRRRKPL